MQSALRRRWRGLKTVETALLGGRGPIASSSLNFAREYERPREPRWATVDLLLRSASSQFAGRGGERFASLKIPPVFAVSGEDPAPIYPVWICRRMVPVSGNGATRQGMQSRRFFCAGKDGTKIMRNMQ